MTYDVAIIGGGIVGLATAKAIVERSRRSVVVLEAREAVAREQTGNNSGVIHSGLYYKAGSLKAKTCTEGRAAMYAFCEEHGIPFERCGKLVVATETAELPALAELQRRGEANDIKGIRRVASEEIRELEPEVSGVAGLLVPETGIVDYLRVAEALATDVEKTGRGEIRLNSRVHSCRHEDGLFSLETTSGSVTSRRLVNCAGLQSDRVAALCGARPQVRIVPFRGEYYTLKANGRRLIRGLVYPVPDPSFPFLGVHFTRRIGGAIEAGPNAVLALKREGYHRASFSARDTADFLSYSGFWRLAARYWRTGVGEAYRSFSKRAFVRALQRLVPSITEDDLDAGGAGVRAQALAPDGRLVDDFQILADAGAIHVLNAPSPAATASIRIGELIAERLEA